MLEKAAQLQVLSGSIKSLPLRRWHHVTHALEVTDILVAENAGPEDAVGVRVRIALPAGVRLVYVTTSGGSCHGTAPIVCSVPNVASGDSVEIRAKLKATTAGRKEVSGRVAGSVRDPDAANNKRTLVTSVSA